MIFWENWAGLSLALFILASMAITRLSFRRPFIQVNTKPGQGKMFAATVALYFVIVMGVDFLQFGLDLFDGSVQFKVDPVIAAKYLTLAHLLGFLMCPLLLVSCMHLADNKDPKSIVRLIYIIFVGVKGAFGQYYAGEQSVGNSSLSDVNQLIEDYSLIFDVLVLLAGTSNPLSDRWQTK